jgi:hypothetical protein
MARPIETLLSLPRVRLIDRVPIIETEAYVRRFIHQIETRTKLVQKSFQVSNESAKQFSADDKGLSTLLAEFNCAQYVVTRNSKRIMEGMLSEICADGDIFKGFEEKIQPLCEISQPLREASRFADSLADRTKEESIDVARALMIELPAHPPTAGGD